MKLRVGQTLSSPVDTTTVVVVRAPDVDVDLTCAGVAMYDARGGEPAPQGEPDGARLNGSVLGKRYVAEDVGLEILCSKGGEGTLAVAGTPLPLRGAKPLPASD